MPAYNSAKCTSIANSESAIVWVASETLVSTSGLNTSQQLFIQDYADNPPGVLTVDLVFSANPGTFEIDIQGANFDTDSDYLLVLGGQVTSATLQTDGTYRASVPIAPWVYKFVRLAMIDTPDNSATTLARITH